MIASDVDPRFPLRNHSAFEELFIYAGPKFITNIAPPYDDAEALATFDEKTLPDPLQHQVKVFLAGVSGQSQNGDVRSLIRLYKSLGAQKLADFLGVDEETIYEIMMVNKRSTRRLKWNEGGLLEGDAVNTSDLDFNIDDVSAEQAVARSAASDPFSPWSRTWSTLPKSRLGAATETGSSATELACTRLLLRSRPSRFRLHRPQPRRQPRKRTPTEAQQVLVHRGRTLSRRVPGATGLPSLRSRLSRCQQALLYCYR